MSRQGSLERAPSEPVETLEVIREEGSPNASVVEIKPKEKPYELYKGTPYYCCRGCKCVEVRKPSMDLEDVDKLLQQKEEQLIVEYNERLNKEIGILKDRADFVLQNEQVRASYMLREAYRERQEKISALQTQLECKNLAGLMFVMCTERNRSKMEKRALIQEYTSYILALQEILAEAQSLILNLSRGYKTAARVDNEWRDKMRKTLQEFQMFVHDYMKGTPESDQFFFDLPKLLKTETPVVDNPAEDPCTCEEEESVEEEEEHEKKPWYEQMDSECRPFVIFGDMAEFKPPQRREVLKAQKKLKSAPGKWREYVFHDMYVNDECSNADAKYEYAERAPAPARWDRPSTLPDSNMLRPSTQYGPGRRCTAASIDMRGGMGSIIKMITGAAPQPQTKAMLLGARDSMEIFSTTKLREKHKHSDVGNVVIDVANRRTSLFKDEYDDEDDNEDDKNIPDQEPRSSKDAEKEDVDDDETGSALGSIHNDSLTVLQSHRPDRDHNINHEKMCPADACQRLHVDSFVRSLPSYMRSSPFTHFEQHFEAYEACSPEQLEILRERIEKKKKKEKEELPEANPLDEWKLAVEGTAVQTSDISMTMPDCTCRGPNPSPVTSTTGQIFNLEDLVPMKQILNQINRDCFYDHTIQFDRFKVVGQQSTDAIKRQTDRERFKSKNKLFEVTKVLKQHPSLLDIFQANAV